MILLYISFSTNGTPKKAAKVSVGTFYIYKRNVLEKLIKTKLKQDCVFITKYISSSIYLLLNS